MTLDMNEALAEHIVIQGISLLSDEARRVLSATPDDFRRVVGAAVYESQGQKAGSDYGRGMYFGRALGILTAGAALGVITYPQLEVLMASLEAIQK
ncbi:hypothetical protein [Pseudomonas monteilii]|uniref:hypothetical protein n=1 Tax=Pseudomonas monteilii TaxID=76759 RepID=UPI003D98365F